MTSKRDFGETERPTRLWSGLFLPSEAAGEGPIDPSSPVSCGLMAFVTSPFPHLLRYLYILEHLCKYMGTYIHEYVYIAYTYMRNLHAYIDLLPRQRHQVSLRMEQTGWHLFFFFFLRIKTGYHFVAQASPEHQTIFLP